MKKLLSLLLVLSLCLSSVILLASCKGKSAYEVAVENGFSGDEKAWLESLKGETGAAGAAGKDGKDGKDGDEGLSGTTGDSAYELGQQAGFIGDVKAWLNSLYGKDGTDGKGVKVEVNEHGYWVINGVPTLSKVDGTGAKVIAIELVNSSFTVIKGNGQIPTVDIKYTLDNNTTGTVGLVDTPIDFTKEGEQTVTLTYSGYSQEVKVNIEGMMVLFQDFSNLSDSATMAQILAETGFKIPVPGPNNTGSTKLSDDTATTYYNNGQGLWYVPEGQTDDLTPYTMAGRFHRPNYFGLSIKDGKLFYEAYAKDVAGTFSGNMSDSCVILADEAYMRYAATGAYTVQMDFTFTPGVDKRPEDDPEAILNSFGSGGAQNVFITLRSTYATSKDKNNGRPDIVGPVFGSDYLAAAGARIGGTYQLDDASITFSNKEALAGSANAINILETMFNDLGAERWLGQTVTVRIVVKETTDTDFGYTVYIKKAGAPDSEFIEAGSFSAANATNKMVTTYLTEGINVVSLHNRSTCGRTGYYIDNIAIWTGNSSMPTNTNTFTYEELNAEYLATLTPAA